MVAAWSEPKELPPGGGQAQILVRAQKRGGAPFPGVEVRLNVSGGTCSRGERSWSPTPPAVRATGSPRAKVSLVTVNAGGTVYRFRVPLRTPESE